MLVHSIVEYCIVLYGLRWTLYLEKSIETCELTSVWDEDASCYVWKHAEAKKSGVCHVTHGWRHGPAHTQEECRETTGVSPMPEGGFACRHTGYHAQYALWWPSGAAVSHPLGDPGRRRYHWYKSCLAWLSWLDDVIVASPSWPHSSSFLSDINFLCILRRFCLTLTLLTFFACICLLQTSGDVYPKKGRV